MSARVRYRVEPTLPGGAAAVYVEHEPEAAGKAGKLEELSHFNTLALALNYCEEGYETRHLRASMRLEHGPQGARFWHGPWVEPSAHREERP